MPEKNSRWIFQTVQTTQNKGIDRIALSDRNMAHELVGIDGSRRYGLRPSSGFKRAHRLVLDKSGPTDVVTDFFPVSFQIKEGDFGYGFVYRKSNGVTAGIYIDFAATVPVGLAVGSAGWGDQSFTLVADIDKDAIMDVVPMGKFVFIFIQGQPTKIFYINYSETRTPQYLPSVVDAGPGKQPKLYVPDDIDTEDYPADLTPSAVENIYAGGAARLYFTTSVPDVDIGFPDLEYKKLEPGDYSFGYYFNDSQTGRRSAFSKVKRIEDNSHSGSFDGAAKFAKLQFYLDTSKYDQICIFRSVRLQAVGGTYGGSILHLDTIYDIADLPVHDATADPDFPSPSDFEEYTCHYELDDIALAMQDVYLEKISYDEEVPRGKSAVSFEGSLLVADPQGGTETGVGTGERTRNVGELRWSSLTERSPELFPINNKYVPDVYNNRIEKLARVGDFALGFSKDRLYHVRKSGIYMKIEDLHAGFGLLSQNGVATAGPLCHFVTSKGLKAVANNGKMDDVMFLDLLLMEEWKDNLEEIQIAYDPYASCLFLLNPTLKKTVAMWFGTGKISEFHDTVFDKVKTGSFPKTPPTAFTSTQATATITVASYGVITATDTITLPAVSNADGSTITSVVLTGHAATTSTTDINNPTFQYGTSNNATALNIKNALNANQHFTVTVVNAVVTVKRTIPGDFCTSTEVTLSLDDAASITKTDFGQGANPTGTLSGFSSTDTMVERAFFLQNAPTTQASHIPGTWKPQIFYLDGEGTKTSGTGTSVLGASVKTFRTLDFELDSMFTLASVAGSASSGGRNITMNAIVGGGLDADVLSTVGAYLYIIKCSDASLVGSKMQVYQATSTGATAIFTAADAEVPAGLLAAGVTATFALSPMYFRWTGPTLPTDSQQDGLPQVYDLFRNKQVSSIGCHFSDVASGYSDLKFFRGQVFTTNSDTAAASESPVDLSGDFIGSSIQNGESPYYASFKGSSAATEGRFGIQDSVINPGIEIFAPDLDYKLMAVIVRGRSTVTDSSQRTSP